MQDVVGNISIKFGEVATAIGRMVDSRLDVTKLYEEVMAMKGYNEAFFGDAFDYLVQSDTLAKAFMVKNQNIRKMGLTNQDDDDAIIEVAAISVLAVGVAIIGAYEHESSIPKESSIESIHQCFHIVLQAILKLYPILIKSPDGTIQPEIMNKYRTTLSNQQEVKCSTQGSVYSGDAHPNHDKFINKKIKIFDEMFFLCGNDRVRGDCAKSFEDIDFDSFSEKDNDNDLEGPSIEKDVQATEASQIKASHKRKRCFEMQDVVGDISIKFRLVTTTIGRMVDSRLDVTKLYEEVMAMEGYNE
ncbi:hypothetical protein FXO37_23946 [Capsicum annuum]|nr:hypothetical protein FXO37_23946 [Capsicum annuum]